MLMDTQYINIQHNNAVPLCWVPHFVYYYAECHYVECRYVECCYTECHNAKCLLGAMIGGVGKVTFAVTNCGRKKVRFKQKRSLSKFKVFWNILVDCDSITKISNFDNLFIFYHYILLGGNLIKTFRSKFAHSFV